MLYMVLWMVLRVMCLYWVCCIGNGIDRDVDGRVGGIGATIVACYGDCVC